MSAKLSLVITNWVKRILLHQVPYWENIFCSAWSRERHDMIILVEVLLLSAALFAQSNNGYDNNSLCGVDQFGRTFNAITGSKNNKYVGIFYEPWLGQHPSQMVGIY